MADDNGRPPSPDDGEPELPEFLDRSKWPNGKPPELRPPAATDATGSTPAAGESDSSATPPVPAPVAGCTLAAYAEAKRLSLDHLTRRGLADTKFQGAPAVAIAYRDPSGAVVAMRYRTALTGAERFKWRKGDKVHLYGRDALADAHDAGCVALVEGESDVHTLTQHGIAALGVPGASSYRESRDAGCFADIDTILVVREPDGGGDTLLRALARSSLRDRVRVVSLAPFKDANDMHRDDPTRFLERWRERVAEAKPLAAVLADMAPTIPAGYRVEPDGVFYDPPDDKPSILICGWLDVLGDGRDFRNGSWGVWVEWRDSEGVPHDHFVPRRALSGDGDDLIRELLDYGLYVAPSRRAREQFRAFLLQARGPKRFRVVAKPGWHGESYVTTGGTFGPAGAEPVRLVGDAARLRATVCGNLDHWRSQVAAPLLSNPLAMFVLCSGFAGPLIRLTDGESGGFHIVGASSRGKTTLLHVAASVWATRAGSWRTTDNGAELDALAGNDALLILDDVSQADPRTVGALAYMLGNGSGKRRMSRDGKARPTAQFRTLVLSTGESSIAERIEDQPGQRARAGQTVRLVGLPAERTHGVFDALPSGEAAGAFAERLALAARDHCGHAGPAFVGRLAADPDAARAFVRDAIRQFMATHVAPLADGQVRRGAHRFALNAAAGELAIAYGILPWPPGAATDAAAACFAAWIAGRGGVGSTDAHIGVERVRAFVERYGLTRFVDISRDAVDTSRLPRDIAGFRRTSAGVSGEYAILGVVFRDEICAGLDYRKVIAELIRRDLLHRDASGKATSVVRVATGYRPRCYIVTDRLIGDGDASSGSATA